MTEYVLGHDADELRRLEEQARTLAPATNLILGSAGIEAGTRVLDLGTGAGDVAFAVADLVGPAGVVVGVDQSADAVAHATRRAAARGLPNVSFLHGDLHSVPIDGPFDAVVGRLVLLYTPNPVAVVERFAGLIRPGGVFVAMEFEINAAGLLPETAFGVMVGSWITEAFRRSGHDPLLGPRLPAVFGNAGLEVIASFGIQGYLQPDDPTAARMVTDLLRTLLPVIEATGIATAAEVDIETLEQRMLADQAEHNAIFKPPTLVGTMARAGG